MQITATLTRFHKIEERFRTKRFELEAEVSHLLSDKQVLLTKGMHSSPVNNKANGEQAIRKLNTIHEISGVICSIRSAIGKKNVELGISNLLAELEQQKYVRRLAGSYKAKSSRNIYGSRETAEGHDSENLAGIFTGLNDAPEAQPLMVTIKGVHTTLESQVTRIVDEYDARINYLSDTISDKNKEKISLEIPDEFAALTGASK